MHVLVVVFGAFSAWVVYKEFSAEFKFLQKREIAHGRILEIERQYNILFSSNLYLDSYTVNRT